MTDEAKALVKWLRSMRSPHTGPAADLIETQAREIEQHEAFRQEVSEFALGVKGYMASVKALAWQDDCDCFIIPKPDPLVGVCDDIGLGPSTTAAEDLRAALAKHGLQVTEIER